MNSLGKIFGAVLGVTLLAAPALAQKRPAAYGEEDKAATPAEKEAAREAEKAYQRSLGNIPVNQKSSDPWGTMRGDSPAPKAAAKAPAKPKAKSAADGTAKQ
jgi:hypothetical protein